MNATHVNTASKGIFIAAILVMLGMAFFQCFETTHDLKWAYDPDFDRDIAFVQGNLDGNFGKDPNYIGQYLWYNPLLFSIETVIVKATGLPINLVVTRAGAYLNFLGPVTFVLMLLFLFDFKIAVSGLLSFLFLASGNILGWGSATYSPWLYPVCFVQFLFYLNIIFLYKALLTQRYLWFFLLGAFVGISFLGHLAPTIIVGLIIISTQGMNLFHALRKKNRVLAGKYFLQCLAIGVPFLITASPLLFFVAGKYELHYVNRSPFEYSEGIFRLRYFGGMLKANLSFSFLVSLAGFYWFYRYFHQRIVRRIVLSWFLICILLYIYSSLIPVLHDRFNIDLPGTVPSFHYFYYLKALQSVFFGIGLVFLLKKPLLWLSGRMRRWRAGINETVLDSRIFITIILLITLVYLPAYRNRQDFVLLREQALQKEGEKDKLEVYHFILKNIPEDKVILCEPEPSIFPVMASGRKMVSINGTFSNPFVSYIQRENDRVAMLGYLVAGSPPSVARLFTQYQVSYILLSLPEAEKIKEGNGLPGKLIFKNDSYIILSMAG